MYHWKFTFAANLNSFYERSNWKPLAKSAKFQNSMDFLEYPSVTAEVRGAMVGGNLRITDKEVVFKHAKSGKKDVVKVATSILFFLIGMLDKWKSRNLFEVL